MAPTTVATTDSLRAALQEFQDSLTPSQKTELLLLKATPDATAVVKFTAEIDRQNAKRQSRGVASRLFGVLESVRQFTSIIDTYVQAYPAIAALVWGSIKITILAVSNFAFFFDQLSEWFMKLRKICPRFVEYQSLFAGYPGLQTALCSFYATVVRFCKHALEVTQRTGYEHAIKSFLKPFAMEFVAFEKDLHAQSKEVELEIRLAAEMAAAQERQLQIIHRDKSFSFWKKATQEADKSESWRRQAEERSLIKRKAQVLDKISTYDHLAALKQARKKRHGTTSLWLSQTEEYRDWLEDSRSSFFWCSGILGAGKTVLTAAIIDDIFCRRSGEDSVSYFFCLYDDAKSLAAKVIIGSLIRQALESRISGSVESKLADLYQCSDLDVNDLEPLFGEVVSSSPTHFIIIDGVDECSKGEQDALLDILARIFSVSSNNLKLFIASRNSLEDDLHNRFEVFYHKSMNNMEVQLDIQTYIEETIREKFKNNHLVLGRTELLFEIRDALVEGADGMFLWVFFQIQDICEQHTDEGIREILRDLPKDMNKTYERVLAKILDQGNSEIAGKVFRWVATVKRPLHLEEIREAMGIKPLQQYMEPERLLNNVTQITSWCRNLIILDEEDLSVRFAHHSTMQFFLHFLNNPRLQEFHINMPDFDHHVGSVCVTYLSLSDFETTLAKNAAREVEVNVESIDILKASLACNPDSAFAKSIFKFDKFWRSRPAKKFELSSLYSYTKPNSLGKIEHQYAFLAYAREYWLAHSSEFTPEEATWKLWKNLLHNKSPLAKRPWSMTEWTNRARSISKWIVENNHYALFSVWFSGLPVSEQMLLEDTIIPMSPLEKSIFRHSLRENFPEYRRIMTSRLLAAAVRREDLQTVRDLVSSRTFQHKAWESDCPELLKAAAIGNSQIVEILLESRVNKEYRDASGNAAAHLAAAGGHDKALQVLHKHGAWLQDQNSDGLTPIDLAQRFCQSQTVWAISPQKYKGWGDWRGYVNEDEEDYGWGFGRGYVDKDVGQSHGPF